MSTGVIQEQGFVTDNSGFGFTPLKEGEERPFGYIAPDKEDEDKSSDK